MKDEYQTYLAFARGFASRFGDRVIGLDDASARLVSVHPPDHILGGFLTPVRREEEGDEDGSVEDLPLDSAYEQTSVGLEWITPEAAGPHTNIEIALSLWVYLRVLPTLSLIHI